MNPHVLKLSPEAHQEWKLFSQTVEIGLRDSGQFENIKGWGGKLPGAAARIAGLLHCADNPSKPWTVPVSLETMRNALDIAAVFSGHALIAFDSMGADKGLNGARKVLNWIKSNDEPSFKKRDCFNALKGSFPRMADLDEPFKILTERNYLKEDIQQTGGRPSVVCHVNPSILGGK